MKDLFFNFNRIERAMIASAIIHGFILGFFVGLETKPPSPERPNSIEFKVIENAPPATPPKPTLLPTNSSKKAPPSAQANSGVSRESTVENASTDAPKVKLGNTLAKAPDNNPSSDAPLPAPAEEFEVSSWPQLTNDIRVAYPREAKAKGIEGLVIMDLYISESGQVKRASIVTGPGYGLNEAAIEAAKKFIFSPAKVGNQTMPVVIRYNYKFVIQK